MCRRKSKLLSDPESLLQISLEKTKRLPETCSILHTFPAATTAAHHPAFASEREWRKPKRSDSRPTGREVENEMGKRQRDLSKSHQTSPFSCLLLHKKQNPEHRAAIYVSDIFESDLNSH